MQVRYSPYDFDVHEDPYTYYARLRDQAPVFRNETDDFWALSRHADVRAALRDSDRFSSRNGFRMDPRSGAVAITVSARVSDNSSCASP